MYVLLRCRLHVPLISSSSLTILLTARFTFLQTSLVVGSAIIDATLSLFGATLSLRCGFTQKVRLVSDRSSAHM